VATDVSHRCMRLKICAIDKKLSFATPRTTGAYLRSPGAAAAGPACASP
jgi:hypothetical protein